MMLDILAALLSCALLGFLGAIAYRLKGAAEFQLAIGRGLTTARAFYAVMVALAVKACADLSAPETWPLALAIFGALCLPWVNSLGVETWPKLLRHSAIGLAGSCAPAVALLLAQRRGWWLPLVVGAAIGPIYRLAGSTERGELVYGGAWAASINGGAMWNS